MIEIFYPYLDSLLQILIDSLTWAILNVWRLIGFIITLWVFNIIYDKIYSVYINS